MAKDSGHRDRADRKIAKLMQYPKKKEIRPLTGYLAHVKLPKVEMKRQLGSIVAADP
jgi:hypothetical protein